MPKIVIYLIKFVLLFAAYFITAKVGLSLDAVSGFATLVWAPTGIALAALLLLGNKFWPAIFLAAFLVNLSTGAPLLVALGMGVGNTLEAVVAAYLLKKFTNIETFLDHLNDVFILIFLAALLSTAVSATIGVTSLYLGGVVPYNKLVDTWIAWWIGDMLGDLIVLPLIIAWSRLSLPVFNLKNTLELLALLLIATFTNLFIFLKLFTNEVYSIVPRLYFIFPVLLWTAVRFEKKTVTSVIAFTAVIAIIATAKGVGPFAVSSSALSANLTGLQIYLAILSTMILSLSAIVTEKKKSTEILEVTAKDKEDTRRKLEVTAEKLSESRETLEQKVIDRTKELVERTTELQSSNERLDLSLKSAKMGSWDLDLINDTAKRTLRHDEIFGYKTLQPKWGAKIFREHVLPEDRAHATQCFDVAFKTGDLNMQCRIKWPDGSIHWIDAQGHVYYKDKKPVRMLGTVTDITLQRETEEKILQAKSRDEAILASIGDGLVAVDKMGKILIVNNAFENLVGWKEKEVLGKLLVEVVPREDEKGDVVPFNERILTKILSTTTTTTTWYYIRRDKTRFPAASIITPFILEGKIIGAVEVFRDITKEKEVGEMKEKELHHEIEIETKEKDFISMASHQLLTPLALMKGYTSMLISGKLGKIDNEARKYLEESLQGSERMSNLVKSLLTTSRIESGNIKIAGTNFDLDEVMRSVATELKPKLEGKKLTIELPSPKKLIVFADKEQTREVLMNVIDNAIKYSEKGTITITEIQTDSMGIVSIKDSGIGINQKDLPHIFEKFYSSENWLQTQSESHGLGLYIAELLLKLMGGTISVESKEKEGSTFNIALPLPKNV